MAEYPSRYYKEFIVKLIAREIPFGRSVPGGASGIVKKKEEKNWKNSQQLESRRDFVPRRERRLKTGRRWALRAPLFIRSKQSAGGVFSLVARKRGGKMRKKRNFTPVPCARAREPARPREPFFFILRKEFYYPRGLRAYLSQH